jgi:hypothetical protein
MREQPSTLRAAALIAASALALHELRYLIGYGGSSGALAGQSHAYLPVAGALVAAVLALAAAQLVRGLRRGGADARATPLWRSWGTCTLALLVVFCGQELTESLLAGGHAPGPAALTADGGGWAVPLALGFGLLVALVLRGAGAALAAVARRSRRATWARGREARRVRLAPAPWTAATSPLARNLAGRAPPATS